MANSLFLVLTLFLLVFHEGVMCMLPCGQTLPHELCLSICLLAAFLISVLFAQPVRSCEQPYFGRICC